MNRNLFIGAVFATLIVAVIALIYLNLQVGREGGTPAASGPVAEPGQEQTGVPAGTSPSGPVSTDVATVGTVPSTLMLYFQGADVGLLFPEERDVVPEGDGGSARARLVLRELAKGPTRDLLPTIPPGTEIREVFFDSTGVAYVDFSSEFRDNHPGGSAEELMTVDSVVNTIARNVAQVQAVQFLIDGRPITTLAGHVNLSVPLRPSSDRIALNP